jgi:hypothetical protein
LDGRADHVHAAGSTNAVSALPAAEEWGEDGVVGISRSRQCADYTSAIAAKIQMIFFDNADVFLLRMVS